MASSDMTALMLQMIKKMQEQHVAQEMMQEQQRAVNECQRQLMAAILKRRADQTPAATRYTVEKSPPIKIDFKEFSGEPEDWTTWSEVHRTHLSALGCADALTETAGDETRVHRDDFDRDSADPDQLHNVQQAWVSLVTSCKGVTFNIANAEESASEAWAKLLQHYQTSGLKEHRRLTIDFYIMKMELGEHSRKFLLRVEQMVKKLERVARPVDPKDIDIVILSELMPQYDTEVRMQESSSDWPTREWTERAVMNQYEGLECETSAAASRAILSVRGHRRNDKRTIRGPLCSRTGHSALQCHEFQIIRREQKPNGYRGDGKHGGNGGGDGNGGGGGGGGNRGGGGGQNCSGGGGKQKKSSKDSESDNRTARSDCYFCVESTKPRNAQTASPLQRRRRLPTPNMAEFRVMSAQSLWLGCLSPQALARLCEWHEDEYWVANSGASKNMTQDSSNLEDYTPPPPGDEVESAGNIVLPVAGYGRLRLLMDQDSGTFKGATRELTLDPVSHVPKLGRHNLLSAKRLTTAFDTPIRVYPVAATIRPCFGRKTLVVFRSLRPETGLFKIKAHRRADIKKPQTPLTTS